MTEVISDAKRLALLRGDREDLLAVLALRFGAVPEPVHARITACDSASTLERWVLVAANVPTWADFLADFDAGLNTFKVVGASYEPIPSGPKPEGVVARADDTRVWSDAPRKEK